MRSKSKVAARQHKRHHSESDYRKAEDARVASITANLKKRRALPTVLEQDRAKEERHEAREVRRDAGEEVDSDAEENEFRKEAQAAAELQDEEVMEDDEADGEEKDSEGERSCLG